MSALVLVSSGGMTIASTNVGGERAELECKVIATSPSSSICQGKQKPLSRSAHYSRTISIKYVTRIFSFSVSLRRFAPPERKNEQQVTQKTQDKTPWADASRGNAMQNSILAVVVNIVVVVVVVGKETKKPIHHAPPPLCSSRLHVNVSIDMQRRLIANIKSMESLLCSFSHVPFVPLCKNHHIILERECSYVQINHHKCKKSDPIIFASRRWYGRNVVSQLDSRRSRRRECCQRVA